MKAARDLENLLSNAPAGGATVIAIVISVLAAILILVAMILAAVSITTAPSPNLTPRVFKILKLAMTSYALQSIWTY